MRKIIISLGLAINAFCIGYEAPIDLHDLQQEHFAHYRVLLLESSIARISELIETVKKHPEQIEEILSLMEKEMNIWKSLLDSSRD